MLNLPEASCTGCGACYNICPHGAITMKENSEGFLYPEIDNEACVRCGLCSKICPVNHPDYGMSETPEFYAAMADDELRQNSSSGGVFPLLAAEILKNGGVVAGAAYTEDFRGVEHILAEDEETLKKLKSSKYVQSNTGRCYSEVQKMLRAGREVLFTGTPCQVAGLKAYLKKDYENLFVVDIICHGVPGPKVFRKYLDELNLGGKLISVNFRDKANGWSPYLTTTTITTTTTYSSSAEHDVFMNLFLSNFDLRKSCGNCPFNKIPRQGDLTIGDFWKINDCNPAYNDGKGTSVILVSSEKGKALLKRVESAFKLLAPVEPAFALKGNKTLTSSYPPHASRDIFFANLDKMSLKENLRRCRREKADVAILNFWWSLNYGAILTAYALQQTLAEQGYTSRLVKFVHKWCRGRYPNSFSKDFARRRLKVSKNFPSAASLSELNSLADTFIVGSDQVFRQKYNKLEGFYFYLPFADPDKKKIACSASFGSDELEGSDEDRQFMKYALAGFDAVSVRENSGVDICREEFGREAVQIADPVFWFSSERWGRLAAEAEVKDRDFVLSYVLDKSETTCNIVDIFRRRTETGHFVDIGNAQKSAGEGMAPEKWLSYIKNCRYLVTDSFHGVCFAVIFNKPFIAVVNKERGASRFESLLKSLGLVSRLLSDEKTAEQIDVFAPVDWQEVNEKVAAESERAKKWLFAALEKPKAPLSAETAAIALANRRLGEQMHKLNVQQYEIAELRKRLDEAGRLLLKIGGLKPLKRRYLRYRLLAALTFGKTRKKYKAKRKECKQKLRSLKKLLKGC